MNSSAQAYNPLTSYVRSFSAGDILRSSVQIYRNNFRTFWIISAFPLLPLLLVESLAELNGHPMVVVSAKLLSMFGGFLVSAAGTVAVSDICLGQHPSVRRSYWRAFSEMPGTIVGTGILLWFVLVFGFLLLLVPGFIFMLWYLFAIPLVVLEQTGGYAALRRSRHLGKGCYLRNSGVYLLLIGSLLIPLFMLTFMVVTLLGIAGIGEELIQGIAGFSGGVLGASIAPIFTIAIVLLYCDMRVRKEAYNIQTLAEELRR